VPSDSWRIVADSRAAQDLKRLKRQHHPIVPKLLRAIDALATDPYTGKPLKGDKRGSYSLRVEDFRVIYDLYPAHQTIHLIRLGDRKDVYR